MKLLIQYVYEENISRTPNDFWMYISMHFCTYILQMCVRVIVKKRLLGKIVLEIDLDMVPACSHIF